MWELFKRKNYLNRIELLIIVSVLVAIGFAPTRAVRFPLHAVNSFSCPCVIVTSCDRALRDIKRGRNPTVCGWTSDELPMVCCPDGNEERTPKHDRRISRLSPRGCGERPVSSTTDGDILVHPSPQPDVLDSGIEPRRAIKLETVSPNREAPAFVTEDDGVVVLLAVGGETAELRWPWMVAIFNGNRNKQLCGGTLIDEKHIITAAHCFTGKSLDPSMYRVQVGDLYLSETNVDYEVTEIKLHEGYRTRYYYDDIAIMRLKRPLANFTAVCLPAGDDVHPGDNATVLGWGDLSFGGPSTFKLQEVKHIPVVDNVRCDAQYRTLTEATFPRGITDTFLCAGVEKGGMDACQGDSGGPLLLEHSKDHWTLIGVVSFGYKCGEPAFPGVYTKLSSYLHWIEKYIGHQNELMAESRRSSHSFRYIDGKPIWKSSTERVHFPR